MPNVIVLGLTQNPSTGRIVAATHGRGAFSLSQSEFAVTAPRLTSVVNMASLSEGPLSSGMAARLLGSNLADVTYQPANPFPLPLSLAGATLTVNDVPAPLYAVSPTQVDFQVPYDISGSVAQVTLNTSSGSATVRLNLAGASPGIFHSGEEANIFHADYLRVSDLAPAQSGEQLVLYASGLGEVSPIVRSGFPATSNPPAETVIRPIVRVGGAEAQVVFSGLTPGWIGIYQINFIVPSGVSGRLPLVVDVGGATSNTVTLSVGP